MSAFIGHQKPTTLLNSVEDKIRLADEYLAAFDTLVKNDASVKSHSLPGMFLLSHGLELLLKSFVEMISQKDPRNYSHELGRLWKKAKDLGLLSDTPQRRPRIDYFVQSLKDGHEKFQFRYLEKSFGFADPVETQAEIQFIRETIVREVRIQRQNETIELAKKGLKSVLLPAGVRLSITRE